MANRYFVGNPIRSDQSWWGVVYDDPSQPPVWKSDFAHVDKTAAIAQAQKWIDTQNKAWRQ